MRLQEIGSVFAAFVFAAAVPAFLVLIPYLSGASLDQFANLFLFSFGIALAHALVLGVPLFLLLHALGRINGFSSIAGGFAVGAAGGVLMTLGRFNSGFSYSSDGVPYVIGGVITSAGWHSYLGILFFLGSLGAIAGLVFWCILKLSGCAIRSADSRLSQSKDNGEAVGGSKVGLGLVIAALLVIGGIVASPALTKDRSCHNKFREVRMIGPAVVRIDLSILTDEWPRLIQFFQEFGTTNQLSFRNSSRNEFGARRVIMVSLCNEAGANIEARQDAWAAGVGISVYQVRPDIDSKTLGRDLAINLERQWPGAVQFLDARGRIISAPQ